LTKRTVYVVQWNLGGLTGLLKMLWDYDFDYDPEDAINDGIWRIAFDKKRDAENFYEGCKFTCQWFRERMDVGE
jgi:hypothetical protein